MFVHMQGCAESCKICAECGRSLSKSEVSRCTVNSSKRKGEVDRERDNGCVLKCRWFVYGFAPLGLVCVDGSEAHGLRAVEERLQCGGGSAPPLGMCSSEELGWSLPKVADLVFHRLQHSTPKWPIHPPC